jgi:O-antigen/teichoic acid export membrane protein
VWSLAYGALLVLFAPDLVAFVLGDDWDGAVPLLQGLAASWAIYQLGFSWIAFARGLGRPRPPALEGLVSLAVFALVALPLLFAAGSGWYAAAMAFSSVCVLGVRAHYVRQLLPGLPLGRLFLRALWPLALAMVAVAAARLATWGGEREAWQAVLELAVFGLVYAVATFAGERHLVRDLRAAARPAPAV